MDPQLPSISLNPDKFQAALAAAKEHFSLVRKKYPDLKAYLVLSLKGQQTGIGSSPKEIFRDFPDLIIDDSTKAALREFLKTPEPKDASDAEKKRLKEKLESLVQELKYDGRGQVELRFGSMNYEQLWQLQTDDLVDRELTPRTKASIRIVLGTVSHFAS